MIATSRSLGPLVRYRVCTASADTEDDIDALPLWAGQSVGLVSNLKSPAEIVRRLPRKPEQFFDAWRNDR